MTVPTCGKIILDFAWKGPSSWNGGCFNGGGNISIVNLIFKNAQTSIHVNIPDDICAPTLKKIRFTCQKPHEGNKKTHPDLLKVTTEQINNLTIKVAGLIAVTHLNSLNINDNSEKEPPEKSANPFDLEIPFELPTHFEIGKKYNLLVNSKNCSVSARLVKESEALIGEEAQNLNLDFTNKADNVHSFSAQADKYADEMQELIGKMQQQIPDIKVPQTKPSETPASLDLLAIEELDSRLIEALKKNNQVASLRLPAILDANTEEINKIIEVEHENTQLIILLIEALKRKIGKAQILESKGFQAAANRLIEAENEVIMLFQEAMRHLVEAFEKL